MWLHKILKRNYCEPFSVSSLLLDANEADLQSGWDPGHFISDTELGNSSPYTWELHLDRFPSAQHFHCNPPYLTSAAFSRNHGYALLCLPPRPRCEDMRASLSQQCTLTL